MNWVSINDGCNECYPYEDIKNQELKCTDHDLGSLNVNEVSYVVKWLPLLALANRIVFTVENYAKSRL